MNNDDKRIKENEFVLDVMIFGLTEKCPFSNDNPENCQLHDVRKRSFEQRLTLIHSLSYEDKIKLFETHKDCMDEKETGYFSSITND